MVVLIGLLLVIKLLNVFLFLKILGINLKYPTTLPSPTVFVSDNLDLDTSKIKVVESIDLSFDLIVRTSNIRITSDYINNINYIFA